jgi:NADPH:quinone reductase-like Zn-dependent oxidoreductase
VAVPADMVFPLPDAVPSDEGAALPLNYLTVHFALHRRARLAAGESVLVHRAAGGVGTAACQLAAAHGARLLAVVSSPEKGEIARAAGAHHVVPVERFLDEVRRLTEGRGVDVVLDPVGGDRFTDSLRSLTRQGRLVVLGFTGRAGEHRRRRTADHAERSRADERTDPPLRPLRASPRASGGPRPRTVPDPPDAGSGRARARRRFGPGVRGRGLGPSPP